MELLILSSRGRPPPTRPAPMHHALHGSEREPLPPAIEARTGDSSTALGDATDAAGGAEPWRAAGAGLGAPWGGRRPTPPRLRGRALEGAAAAPPARLVSMVHSLRAGAPGGGPLPRHGGVPQGHAHGPGLRDARAPAWPSSGPENSGNASLNACGAPTSRLAEWPAEARSSWLPADAGERDAHMGVWPPPPGARSERAKPVVDTPLGELPAFFSVMVL